jgi:predicted house-cleaning noncanonical NTP pyrophosphatase (MazG superfamily)
MPKQKVTYHNKLVRDAIPTIIRRNGEHAEYRILSSGQRRRLLLEKFPEEAKELAAAGTVKQRLLEAVDLLELIDTIAADEGLSRSDMRKLQLAKRKKCGGFKMGTFLIYTSKQRKGRR